MQLVEMSNFFFLSSVDLSLYFQVMSNMSYKKYILCLLKELQMDLD